MIKPDIPNNSTHVLRKIYLSPSIKQRVLQQTHRRLRRAHQSVKTKKAARTKLATLLAFVSNPHAISAAPIKPEPRYPAGSVSHGIPPDIIVAPPSSAVSVVVSHRLAKRRKEGRTIELDRVDMRTREHAHERMAHLHTSAQSSNIFLTHQNTLPRGTRP